MASQEDLEKKLNTPPQPLDLSKVESAASSSDDKKKDKESKQEDEAGKKVSFWRKIKAKLPRVNWEKCKICKHKHLLPYVGLAALLSFALIYFGLDSMFFKGQFINQKGAYATVASLKLVPEETAVAVGETVDVELKLNTSGEEVVSTDIYINYNTDDLEVVDSLSITSGVQILPTDTFSNIYTNIADSSKGEITFIAGMPRGQSVSANEDETIAVITFKALKKTNTSIEIDYNPEIITSTDSNVNFYVAGSRDVGDILGSVSNASLELGGSVDPKSEELEASIVEPSSNEDIEEGDEVEFEGEVEGGTKPYEYLWDFDDPDIDDSEELTPGEIRFRDEGVYNVRFTVTDANGETDSDTVRITVEEEEEVPEDEDSDNDGILDSEESVPGEDDYVTNPNNADTDGDSYEDLVEISNYYVPVHDSKLNVFSDISPVHPFYKYIEILDHYEATNGYPDGSFKPKNTITRAEALKMIIDGLEIQKQSCASLPFTDIPQGHWVRDYVCTAYSRGIASGSGNVFRPWTHITRAEFVKILVNAKGLSLSTGTPRFSDVQDTEFDRYIKTATDAELINGYTPTVFGPWRNILREEASKIIARTIRLGKFNGQKEPKALRSIQKQILL